MDSNRSGSGTRGGSSSRFADPTAAGSTMNVVYSGNPVAASQGHGLQQQQQQQQHEVSYSAPLYPPPPPSSANPSAVTDNDSGAFINAPSVQGMSVVPRLTDSPANAALALAPASAFAAGGTSATQLPSSGGVSGIRQSTAHHPLSSSTDRFMPYGSNNRSLNSSSTTLGGPNAASETGRFESISMKPHSRNQSTQFLVAHGKGHLTPELAAAAQVHAEAHGGSNGGGGEISRHGSEYESTEHQMRGKTFLGGLIKPPVVRQFLHNGYLYKEEEERGISHFELFADLIFVAIVHIFGEAAAEEATLINALKFLLMFWPPWSIWADMRSYLNVSGTDDAIQRGYILITSILLIGYTAQGASIKLILPGEEGSPSSNPGTHEASPSLSAAIAEATSSLVGESSNVHRRDLALEHPTLSEGGYAALRAATAFFLIAKAIRIALLIFYAISLPRFRAAHLLQAFFTLLPCLVFFRMFFVDSVVGAMGIFILGVFLDILGKYVAGILVHSGSTRKRHQFFIPALEIGHVIDKTAAFFVLVAGEILIAVSYIAEEESEIGAHGEFWRSALGVVIAFLLCWIYFDADSCKVFVHAIRRHWFSSITWTQLHLPLCAGLVIAAAAAHKMILKSKVDQGLRWYFAGGMTAIMVCLGIMGFLHKSLDKPGSGLIPRWIRLSLRIVLGGFFVTFPLYSNESSVMELGVYAAGLGALVCVETVGKIGTVGNLVERSVRMNGDDGGGGTAYLGVDSTSESLLPSLGGYHDEAMKAPVGTTTAVEYVVGSKRFKWDELTAYEKGEEDVGGVNSVGLMKAVSIRRGQRTGLAAF